MRKIFVPPVMAALAKTICKTQMQTFYKTCMLMVWMEVKGDSNELIFVIFVYELNTDCFINALVKN